jgi:hypothetical protein
VVLGMNPYDANDNYDQRSGARKGSVVYVVYVVAQRSRKEIDLGKYLDLVEAADRARRSPTGTPRATDRNTVSNVVDEGGSPSPAAAGAEARSLIASGWKPKVRLGKTIWQRPDTGFWVSEEMALHLLDGTEPSEQERGKAGRVTQQRGDAP